MPIKKTLSQNWRLWTLFSFIVLMFGIILYRIFMIAYFQHESYEQIAENQVEYASKEFTRGNIYVTDKNGTLMLVATNKKFPFPVISPQKIDISQKEVVAKSIENITGISMNDILKILNRDSDLAYPLRTRLSDEQVAQIEGLGLSGVRIIYEADRTYPQNTFAADVVGFLGYSGNIRAGQYGIEAFYDDELRGENRTASWPIIPGIFSGLSKGAGDEAKKQDRPRDIILTIDKNIQAYVEDALTKVIERLDATSGNIIVQEPRTGRILAMVDMPSFDPNMYAEADAYSFLNATLQEVFEPGSSFKPITMAAGLNENKVDPQSMYRDVGVVKVAGYTIRNYDNEAHGTQTMTQILEKSLNTGAMYVQESVGNDSFLNYVINFGFGQKTGIDLPGEVGGDISNLYEGRNINFLTASFGQGIAVTPIQLVSAYSAIANGGKMMRPYIVEKIIVEGEGESVTEPELTGTPISDRTASRLAIMLVSVVDNGFDKARIAGYDIAGKTGTAQIPGKGGYEEGEFIHDFVGFAPAFDPRFTILIKLDRPQGIRYAADSLSPVFRDIASYILSYYDIPPTR